MSIGFRDAAGADIQAVVALVESAYRGDASRVGWTTEADLLDGQRTDAGAIRDILESQSSTMLLALDGDELVGCCQLELRADGVCYFGSFAVRPSLQGGGVGKELLSEAERRARDAWLCSTMEMTVIEQREDLIAWYERRGYRRTGERRPFPYGDDRFGLPRRDDLGFVVLVKPL